MEALDNSQISQLQPTGCTFPVYCSENAPCNDCKELKMVDMNLSQLDQHRWKAALSKRKYRRLHERRFIILSRINAQRDPMSAKLPPEVACQIFEAYIGLHPAQEIDLWPLSKDIHRGHPIYFETFQPSAHLRLGAVCRQWRSIAWGYSPLWNTLHINITTKHYGDSPQLILEWLERSKDLPLDIRAVPSDSARGLGVSLGMDMTVLKAIKACVSRWRSVDLRIDEDSIAMDLADTHFLRREQPSNLRRLSLYGQYYDEYPPINFLSYARREHCNLQFLLALTASVILWPDWTNMTHLHIHGMSMSSVWVLIQLVASIEAPITHLSLAYTPFYDHPSWASQPVIHLPMLSSLSLQHGVSPLTANLLFSSLTAPALESLDWSHLEYGVGGYQDFDTFYSFTSRSRCCIHAFYIRNLQDIDDEDIIGLLSAVPTLRDLSVNTDSGYSLRRLLNLLSQRNFVTSKTPSLPRLRRLFVDGCCDADAYTWSSIVGVFVEDRFDVRNGRTHTQGQRMPTPGRSGLQMTVSITRLASDHGLLTIGRDYLASLVQLWQEHGVFCILREIRNQKPLNILDPSRFQHLSPIEDGLLDSLMIMSTLRF